MDFQKYGTITEVQEAYVVDGEIKNQRFTMEFGKEGKEFLIDKFILYADDMLPSQGNVQNLQVGNRVTVRGYITGNWSDKYQRFFISFVVKKIENGDTTEHMARTTTDERPVAAPSSAPAQECEETEQEPF